MGRVRSGSGGALGASAGLQLAEGRKTFLQRRVAASWGFTAGAFGPGRKKVPLLPSPSLPNGMSFCLLSSVAAMKLKRNLLE